MININFDISDALKILYTDKLKIERHSPVLGTDGTINYGDPSGLTLILDNEPCRLSIKALDNPPDMLRVEGEYELIQLKVICGNNVDIRTGDLVSVTRNNGIDSDVVEGVAAQPGIYRTHKEIFLNQRGRG